MVARLRDPATLLEAGIGLFVAALLGALAVLLFGRSAGAASHGQQHAQGAPAPGSVPPERHQHIQDVSAR